MDLEGSRERAQLALEKREFSRAAREWLAVHIHSGLQSDLAAAFRCLTALGRHDVVDDILASGGVKALARSALAALHAYEKTNLLEFWRRALEHLTQFSSPDAGVHDLLLQTCRDYRLSATALEQVTGRAPPADIAAAIAPHSDWTPQPLAQWRDRFENLQEGRQFSEALALLLKHYDWNNPEEDVYHSAFRVLKRSGVAGIYLSNYLRMAPFQNGDPGIRPLENHVKRLYQELRTGEIAQVLACRPLISPQLEYYRLLAVSDLGLDEPAIPGSADFAGKFAPLFRKREENRAARGTKRLPRVSLRPRVALCVSGQLRAYEKAMRRLLTRLRQETDLDVFVSTWSDVGAGSFGEQHIDRLLSHKLSEHILRLPEPEKALAAMLPRLHGRTFEPACPTKLSEFFKPVELNIEDDAGFLETLDPAIPRSAANQFKMFYKIYDAWRMADAHARSTGIEYDYIIRIRPDLFLRHLSLEEVGRRILYDDQVGGFRAGEADFDDQFAIGGPAAMAAYCSVWTVLNDHVLKEPLPTTRGRLNEHLVLAHLMIQGIRPLILRESVSSGLRHLAWSEGEVAVELLEAKAEGPLSHQQQRLLALAQGGR